MKTLQLTIICLLISQIVYSQEVRVLKGRITTDKEPLIGQSIMEYNTSNGAVSQMNGEFELTIEKDKEILLVLSQCFQNGYVIVEASTDFIEIEMNHKFIRKSKRTWKKWRRKYANR